MLAIRSTNGPCCTAARQLTVVLLQGVEDDAADVEVEPHADGVRGDQHRVLVVAVVEQASLQAAHFWRERAIDDTRPQPSLLLDHLHAAQQAVNHQSTFAASEPLDQTEQPSHHDELPAAGATGCVILRLQQTDCPAAARR